MDLRSHQDLWELVPELPEVEQFLAESLHFPFLRKMPADASFLQELKGKKVRPALFLITARMHGDRLNELVPVAAALELVHMATLVHDDVVDNARFRRDRPTVNQMLGNKMAVLTGDYLFARAFKLLTAYGSMEIVDLMAEVVAQMSSGELQQQLDSFDPGLSEQQYLERNRQKTAAFMASCCMAGGVAAGAEDPVNFSLYQYGLHMGMAFQLIDDILDFYGEEKETGKEACSDLRNGVVTLPLIYTLRGSQHGERLASWIREGNMDEERIQFILDEVKQCGGLNYSARKAEQYMQEALAFLTEIPSPEVVESLKTVSRLIISRL